MTYTEFYKKHYREVYQYVLSRLSDENEAKDFTQDIFIKIFSNWKNIDPRKGSPRTYLFNTVKNMFIDKSRKRNLGQKMSFAEEQKDSAPDIGSVFIFSNWNPELESINNEYISNFKKELLSLPIKQKRVANLYFVHGYTSDTISDRTNIPAGTVRPMIKKLREFFFKTLKHG